MKKNEKNGFYQGLNDGGNSMEKKKVVKTGLTIMGVGFAAGLGLVIITKKVFDQIFVEDDWSDEDWSTEDELEGKIN
ncbi:MAG: hypothetical protein JJE03_00165 [Peptostreptococcaceae bacterium]|nr:hypothetical protein [Peptostreptococcaceae bacterium]